jgi:hypothetical protein
MQVSLAFLALSIIKYNSQMKLIPHEDHRTNSIPSKHKIEGNDIHSFIVASQILSCLQRSRIKLGTGYTQELQTRELLLIAARSWATPLPFLPICITKQIDIFSLS